MATTPAVLSASTVDQVLPSQCSPGPHTSVAVAPKIDVTGRSSSCSSDRPAPAHALPSKCIRLPNVAAAPRRLTTPPTQTSVGRLAHTDSKTMAPSAAGNGSVTSFPFSS